MHPSGGFFRVYAVPIPAVLPGGDDFIFFRRPQFFGECFFSFSFLMPTEVVMPESRRAAVLFDIVAHAVPTVHSRSMREFVVTSKVKVTPSPPCSA